MNANMALFVARLMRLGRLIRRGIQVTPSMQLRIVMLILEAIAKRRAKQRADAAADELVTKAAEIIPVLPVDAVRADVLARLPAEEVAAKTETVKKLRRAYTKRKKKDEQVAVDATAVPLDADAAVAAMLSEDSTDTAQASIAGPVTDVVDTEDCDDIRE